MRGVARDIADFYATRYVEDDRLRQSPHARLVERDPAMLAASAHLLAVAHR